MNYKGGVIGVNDCSGLGLALRSPSVYQAVVIAVLDPAIHSVTLKKR
jgi:hypothetical protein